ncbi:MAG: DeoR/GlpR family DNA-binding transcription regulator [Clostridiales bacterium]|nr:DeoR/GlpR family DNA-binding transcription regulator [Clostridiales bacterium]
MKEQRLDSLEQFILKKRSVTIDEILENFHISPNTIRRDLNELVKRGNVIKVYGGAKAVDVEPVVLPLSGFHDRNIVNANEKQYICQLAGNLVSEGDIIYIDTGTSCVGIIEHIKDIHCTVITNSLDIVNRALPHMNLNIIMLPGSLNRTTLSFTGTDTIEKLKVYNIRKAFMACTGLTIENGLTNASFDEYSVKKTVIENSSMHYLLADHSKFGQIALHTYCDLSAMNAIITDQKPPERYVTYCQKNNIDVLY